MKVSGFTFIRNASQLGYPVIQSIQSALPIVDEFIVVVGKSNDDTLALVESIKDPKIRIIQTTWNTHIRDNGFILAQQKMIGQYACTGDWALYIEGDELLHERDYANIKAAMEKHLNDPTIEALVFNYLHFYGNKSTVAWSPCWYRQAARIIKTSVRSFAPDGLYWTILLNNKKTRYPNAALCNAYMYHYGYVRQEQQMMIKANQLKHFYENSANEAHAYTDIDPHTLHKFNGTHPKVLGNFFTDSSKVFQANPNHQLTRRERKNRSGMRLEKLFNRDLSRKHFQLAIKSERQQRLTLDTIENLN